MKILLHSYNTCFQNAAGGMQSRILTYKSHLEKNTQFCVDYFSPTTTKVQDYDVLHLFRLDMENYALTAYAKKCGLKIIISSVVPLSAGRRTDVLRMLSFLPVLTTYKMEKSQLDAADWIVVESKRERDFVHKHYRVDSNKIVIIPNGFELQQSYNGKEIFEIIGNKGDYILTVGRIDPNKNQLNLIKAVKKTNIPLVIIGGPDSNSKGYYQQCLEEAKSASNIFMLGWIDNESNIIKSAYANCKLFVLPSHYETFGMTILEAVAYGSNIAVSETLPILDFEAFESVDRFNPKSVDSIEKCIQNAIHKKADNTLRDKLLDDFSWDQVVQKYIDCYC